MCRRAVAEGSARVDLQLDAGIGGLEIGEVREKPALQEADRHPDRQRLLAGVAQERTGFLDLAQRRLHHVQVFPARPGQGDRSEEHTSELQSLMRISYAVFCLKKKTTTHQYLTLRPQ